MMSSWLLLSSLALGYIVGKSPDEVKKVIDYIKKEKQLKVYVDPKKRVFWPIDLPFYVRLATGNDSDSDSYLLKDVMVKRLEGAQEQINEGVRLDIPGSQFLRWVNHVSQEEVMFRFIADAGAPTTSLKFNDAPRYSAGDKIFFGKGLSVAVLSQDEHSGVKQVFYTIDQDDVAEYQKPLQLRKQHSYRFGHTAVDHVGYRSRIQTNYFTVDTSSPSTDVSYEKNHISTTFSQDTLIKLSSADNLSGVQDIFYKFNNQDKFRKYSPEDGISVATLSTGSQILKFFSIDNVENRERSQEFQFTLDKEAPQIAYTFLGDFHVDKNTRFISPDTQISLDATDSLSEVAGIEYQINDSPKRAYASTFLPAINNGEFSLKYEAVDSLKNRSQQETVKIIVDGTPPTSSHSFSGPLHNRKNGGVFYISGNTKLSFKAEDQHSGVARILSQINTQAPMAYQKPIQLGKEGRYLVRYWAQDKVNNNERINPILVIVDNTPPEIVENFSFDPLGEEQEGNESIPVYDRQISIGLTGRDSASGVQTVEYSLDKKTWNEYQEFLKFDKPGTYTLLVRTQDQVGNSSQKTIKFKVAGEGWGTYAH
ncbi:OmpL47-type beta-barrel domain-containing protein [Pseudobacteriovorax antillogorgiicola]|nr:hypothetical protein [Pseudobacteriovorax antillogorgiicola]